MKEKIVQFFQVIVPMAWNILFHPSINGFFLLQQELKQLGEGYGNGQK